MYLSLINSMSSSLNESNSFVMAFNTNRCGASWSVLSILSVYDFITLVKYNLILNFISFITLILSTKKAPLIRGVRLHDILMPPCAELRTMTRHLLSAFCFAKFLLFSYGYYFVPLVYLVID